MGGFLFSRRCLVFFFKGGVLQWLLCRERVVVGYISWFLDFLILVFFPGMVGCPVTFLKRSGWWALVSGEDVQLGAEVLLGKLMRDRTRPAIKMFC